jgi:hypothetical protein
MKILNPKEIKKFEQIPNVGPRIARDFRTLGIKSPADLAKQDALKMYLKLQKLTNTKHDPCVLDTFMAVVDFMKGAEAKPWWRYTPERKKLLSQKINLKFK